MKFCTLSAKSDFYKYIQEKFPKLSSVISEINLQTSWKCFNIHIQTNDVIIQTSVHYEVKSPNYEINTRHLNLELTKLLNQYEEQLNRNTQAKFNYQLLKVLVQPFVDGELDDVLKFDKYGNISTKINLKYKKINYYLDIYKLNYEEPIDIEDICVYENGYDKNYNIGIPIYEFINDTDNSIKKLKMMSKKINECCVAFYEAKERINDKWTRITRQLESRKEKQIAKLSNWKEN